MLWRLLRFLDEPVQQYHAALREQKIIRAIRPRERLLRISHNSWPSDRTSGITKLRGHG